MNRRALAVLLLALAAVWPASAPAQQDLLDFAVASRTFVVTLSGSIGGKPFSGVRAQVVINHGAGESENPLQILITAFPTLGERNSFFWNSDRTVLDALANRVRSRLRAGAPKGTELHFYYMSPALAKRKGMATRNESERLRWIDAHATPLEVAALEGELELSVHGNRVTGTVWMTGFDPRGHDPVRYQASFAGMESVREQPRP